jgi:hypothetical protein
MANMICITDAERSSHVSVPRQFVQTSTILSEMMGSRSFIDGTQSVFPASCLRYLGDGAGCAGRHIQPVCLVALSSFRFYHHERYVLCGIDSDPQIMSKRS